MEIQTWLSNQYQTNTDLVLMKKELPPRPTSKKHLPATHYDDFDRSSMTCEEIMPDVPAEQINEALKQGFTILRREHKSATMSRTVRFTM